MSRVKYINRRNFIKQSTFGLIGGGVMSRAGMLRSIQPQTETVSDMPRIQEYRTLGRTGFKVSDIGAGDFDDVGPFRALLDAGVNYVDTSETYGQHGRKIGEAIKSRDRSSLFISSKLMADTSSRRIRTIGIDKEGFMQRANRVLETMQLDYLDCLMLSSPETVDMLKTPGFHEATEQLKKEGSLYCRHACGVCEPHCPHEVPVNTIMRYDHYFVSQGREKHAMAKYAALKSTTADKCQSCAGYCEFACPYGVPVRALLSTAHHTLTLT